MKNFIQNLIKSSNISAKSFVVTFFGDVMSQHSDWISMASLISIMDLFEISERSVRTSVYRLVQEDWLESQKIGRKSFYALTDNARRHYQKAAKRIYFSSNSNTTSLEHKHNSNYEKWLLVVSVFVSKEKLKKLRRQLHWLGFSTLTHGVFAHPSVDSSSLDETLKEMALEDEVLIFDSQTLNEKSHQILKQLVHEKRHIQQLENNYADFVSCFKPIVDNKNQQKNQQKSQQTLLETSNPELDFKLRLLLIHQYRRILLKDHDLPDNLLPTNWIGKQAQQLVSEIYKSIALSSIDYITRNIENYQGNLPEEHTEFWQRFE